MRILFFIFLTIFLNSCSLLSPVKNDEKTYVLNTTPCNVLHKSRQKIILLVPEPEASAIYNTRLMAYSLCPYHIAYFAKNSWAAKPAQMLQPLLVCTLEKTHHFSAIITSGTGHADYVLNMQVLELKQDFSRSLSYETLKIRVQIVNAENNEIIASKDFCDFEVAPCCNPYGGVIAANRLEARVLQRIAYFVISVI